MQTETLLVEIGTEELPPKALKQLSMAFADGFTQQLNEHELAFDRVQPLASARRLALLVHGLEAKQADKVVEKRGPSVDVAFDADGNPTKAAEGWARSNGITVAEAERFETDKGTWLLYKESVAGQPVTALVPGMTEQALKRLPIPKPMRWGSSDVQFIRPVHTITLLFGSQLIAGEVLGVTSATRLQGHRFHCPEGTQVSHANDYVETMRAAHVVVDFAERRKLIEMAIAEKAAELGGKVVADPALLDEVTALVEWPVALNASFDKSFLDVPKEPLIVTMKDDQRYFPLEDAQGNLMPAFIFITNIESKDPQQIISGNEKVVRPRLADARFFFESDKKSSLESRLEALSQVLFQKQLGSIKDKSERIARLAAEVSDRIKADSNVAERAGLLSKADLATHMVSEFPETQGVMGMHYARNDGEKDAVAQAIYEHYLPRFAGDVLPGSAEGCAVAIADKLDTLVGIFGIGQTPKGDRDPFALRRAAIGLLRILVEKQLKLDLVDLVETAAAGFKTRLTSKTVTQDVVDFLLARFRAFYQEAGIANEVVSAVLVRRPTEPVDFDARVRAVNKFRELPEAEALTAANKRVSNILAKVETAIPDTIDENKLKEQSEVTLYNALKEAQKASAAALATHDYSAALAEFASLQEPVDAFFENVMVNADDAEIRNNRLALLQQLRELFLDIADISVLN